jgi:hypothetical protein
MKRQFCKWKDVGAVVPIRTSSRIWSSLKLAAGSKYLVALRLRIQSMTALVIVIPSLMGIPMGERWVKVLECFRWGRLCFAHIGARQPADLDSVGRLRASMGVRRSGTNADDRLPLASLGRV